MPYTAKSLPFAWVTTLGLFGSRKRPRIVSDSREPSPLDLDPIDVYRWESEGGAPRKYVSRSIGGPLQS